MNAKLQGIVAPSSVTLLWKAQRKSWGFVFFVIILLVREVAESRPLVFSLACIISPVCGQDITLPASPPVGVILIILHEGEKQLHGKMHKVSISTESRH